MIAMYIIYYKQGFPFFDANTLGYFLQLKKSSKKDFGYIYFSVCPEFNGKNLVFGTPSNAGSWKEPFFYIHDVPRMKTTFNYNPGSEAILTSFPFYFLLSNFFTSFLSSQLLLREPF